MKRKCLAVGIILLFVGTGIIPSMAQNIEKPSQSTSRGNWLYVGGSGPGNYTKIQDAINNASHGDTIFIFDDSSPYYEHVGIDKSIILIGENRNTTILDGNKSGPIVSITADAVTMRNLSVTNGGPTAAGVLCNSNDVNIQSCVFSQNQDGILVDHTDSTETSQLIRVSDNIVIDNFNGITFLDTIRSSISGNYLVNNSYGITIGTLQRPMNTLAISASSLNVATNNYVADSLVAITINHSFDNRIQDNIIEKNEKAIFIYGSYGWGCDNVLERNLITQNDRGIVMISWFLGGASGNRITQNTFEGNKRNVFYALWENNSWDGNYWGRGRLLPYPIVGWMHPGNLVKDFFPNLKIPWVEFDHHPAKKPYDIGR